MDDHLSLPSFFSTDLKMMAFWFFICAFVSYLIYILHAYFIQPLYSMYYFRKQSIKCCPFVPFFGQISEFKKINYKFRSDPNYEGSTIPFFDVMLKTLGSPFVYCIGPQLRLVITDPILIRKIYIERNDVYHKSDILREFKLFGNGILTSSGDLWFHQRKLLTVAFSGKEMKRLFPTMVECARSTFNQWTNRLKSESNFEIDISKAFSALTLQVIGQTAFGANISGDTETSSLILECFSDYLQSVIRYSRGSGLIPIYRNLPTNEKRHIQKIEKQIKVLMFNLIKNRQQIRKEKNHSKKSGISNVNDNDMPSPSSNGTLSIDLLEILLSASENQDEKSNFHMTDQLLMDNCFTFLLAGHETTSNLLTWTVFLLCQHPDWQEKARQEVFSILGNSGDLLHEHLSQLKLIGWVLNESMRLYPPVSLITRKCTVHNVLGNIMLPKSVDIVVPVSYLHRSPNLWGDNSYEFDPSRFANGLSKACNEPMGFLPFSAGPRTCIGQNFAMMEAKALLSLMLLSFKWRLSAGYRHCPHVVITLTPKYGLPLILEAIN